LKIDKLDFLVQIQFLNNLQRAVRMFGANELLNLFAEKAEGIELIQFISALSFVEWLNTFKLIKEEKEHGEQNQSGEADGQEREGDGEGDGQEREVDRILELLEQCGARVEDHRRSSRAKDE